MNRLEPAELTRRARGIRLALFDMDGVFTDGGLYYTDQMMELRVFNVHDGLGVKLLRRAGIEVGLISSRESELVRHRMRELGVEHIYQNQADKLVAYEELLSATGVDARSCLYAGDDLPDLPVMQRVGLAIAVANARPEVNALAHWRTKAKGGSGAVREVCELVLKAQNRFNELVENFKTPTA